MANYFSIFPKILYSFDGYKISEYVSNILTRFSFENELKNNFSAYFLYTIEDGDTPEIVASKYYDSPNKHWLILMMNDIVDPQFDWPLESSALNLYIDSKYMESANSNVAGDGIVWSQLNIKSYYKKETITTPDNYSTINLFEIDANTYANTAHTVETVLLQDGNVITIDTDKTYKNYYDYELENNESKREIKLLRREFLPAIEQEIKRIFS